MVCHERPERFILAPRGGSSAYARAMPLRRRRRRRRAVVVLLVYQLVVLLHNAPVVVFLHLWPVPRQPLLGLLLLDVVGQEVVNLEVRTVWSANTESATRS